ncbi:hypothetical protein ACLB2K_029402 [Fragaria x ananassa]
MHEKLKSVRIESRDTRSDPNPEQLCWLRFHHSIFNKEGGGNLDAQIERLWLVLEKQMTCGMTVATSTTATTPSSSAAPTAASAAPSTVCPVLLQGYVTHGAYMGPIVARQQMNILSYSSVFSGFQFEILKLASQKTSSYCGIGEVDDYPELSMLLTSKGWVPMFTS